MALTLLHADDFNRSDGSLEGSTMSDGLGAWASPAGTWDILSNEAKNSSWSSDIGIWDAAMSAVGDQKAQAKVRTNDSGVIVRHNEGGAGAATYYLAYLNAATIYLYRRDAGGFSLLSSLASAAVDDVIGISAVGTTIEGFVNGVSAGTVTDATLATGKAGLYGGGGGTSTFDDFADYVESASPSPIDGSAAGGSTASGALTGTGAAAGSAAGAGATSGSLAGTGALAGAAGGAATTAAEATGTGALVGTSAGEAAVVAALVGTGALAGSAAGVATVSGAFPATAAPAPILVARLSDYRAQRLLDPMADRVNDFRAQRIHP